MSGKASPMVVLQEVSLSMGGAQRLLQDVSLEIASGDYCCIIGPNGAGKSTLLKCIDGIYTHWCGLIAVGGHPVQSLTAHQLARAVGYVPQSKGALPDYTVREFLHMSRFGWGRGSGDEACVENALSLVGMTSFAQRLLPTLSGGECQKVFIAAGLVQETPLLLLDEPLSFLDPHFQVQISALLRKINRQDGKTVVSVTHELNGALRDGTKIIAMKQGRVAFVKTPMEIWEEKALDGLFETTFTYMKNSSTGSLMVTLD